VKICGPARAGERPGRVDALCLQSYVRLKLASVRTFGAALITRLRGVPAELADGAVVAEIIDAWALAKGIVSSAPTARRSNSSADRAERSRLGEISLAFDVNYRERRLHFLIEGQNRSISSSTRSISRASTRWWSRLKREFYIRLDRLRRRHDAAFYSQDRPRSRDRDFPRAAVERRHQASRSLCARNSSRRTPTRSTA